MTNSLSPEATLFSDARVLVVEGAAGGFSLREALRALGYGPVAVSVEALLRGARPPEFDLAVIDAAPPGLDGCALCRTLRAQPAWDPVPVALAGAGLDSADVARGLDAGADEVLRLPLDPRELRARLDRLLQRPSAGSAAGDLHLGDLVAVLTRLCDVLEDDGEAHAARVGAYAALLAESLGLGAAEARELSLAARLHDLGTFRLPRSLVRRRGPLTVAQFEVVKEHTVLGAQLLGASPALEAARQVALGHHERWDGTGYPAGRVGEAIPLPARITLLADVYDTLRRPRPYREAFSHAAAREIIARGDWRTSPEHFDPAVLDAFLGRHRQFEALYEAGGSPERP